MASRMEKYEQDGSSRTNKNKDIYNDLYNKEYEFDREVNVKSNEVSLDGNGLPKTREAYRKASANVFRSETNEEESYELPTKKEKKVYDINSIIEEAKENKDEEEALKKLQNSEYNIFTSLKIEADQLEKTITIERENLKANKEELTELINTISQKTLEKGLMDDLLPSDDEEDTTTDISLEINKEEIEEKKEELKNTKEENTFYDGTAVIKEKDIVNEDDEEEEEKTGAGVKILFIFLILIVLGIVGYFAYQFLIN